MNEVYPIGVDKFYHDKRQDGYLGKTTEYVKTGMKAGTIVGVQPEEGYYYFVLERYDGKRIIVCGPDVQVSKRCKECKEIGSVGDFAPHSKICRFCRNLEGYIK